MGDDCHNRPPKTTTGVVCRRACRVVARGARAPKSDSPLRPRAATLHWLTRERSHSDRVVTNRLGASIAAAHRIDQGRPRLLFAAVAAGDGVPVSVARGRWRVARRPSAPMGFSETSRIRSSRPSRTGEGYLDSQITRSAAHVRPAWRGCVALSTTGRPASTTRVYNHGAGGITDRYLARTRTGAAAIEDMQAIGDYIRAGLRGVHTLSENSS